MTPDPQPPGAHLEVLITQVAGDVKLVLSKVDDTNRRVGVVEDRVTHHDTEIAAMRAQMWRWVGASSAISALVVGGGTAALTKILGG